MSDPVILILSLVVTAVICALLYLVRRGVQNQAWKDLLGISIAFVVLVFATLGIFVGEHAGG